MRRQKREICCTRTFVGLMIIQVFVLLAGSAVAQDVKHDLEKINAVYKNTKQYEMQVEYILYENYTTTAPYKKENALMKRNGAVRYMKIGEMESISTQEYTLIANHEDKAISLLPKTNKKDISDRDVQINLDSLRTVCTKYTFKKENAKTGTYTFELNEYSEYYKVVISFNLSTFFISKMVLYLGEQDITEDEQQKIAVPRMEIIYSPPSTKLTNGTNDFSYEKFLNKKGKKYSLKPAYKEYKLDAYTL